MDRCRFITHKGKQIYLLDFTDSSIEEAQGWFERAAEDIRAQPEGSVLTFIKIRGAKFDRNVIAGLRELAQGNAPYVKASAVVGMTRIQRVVFDALVRITGRNFTTFDSEEEALDFLFSQG